MGAPTVTVEPAFYAEGGNFRVNSAASDWQRNADAVALDGGGYVVTWISHPNGSVASRVHAQVYGADGAAVGSEFLVGNVQSGYQESPRVAALAGGGFVIGWSWQIYGGANQVNAQRYDSAGQALGNEIAIGTAPVDSSSPASIDLIGLSSGGFAAVWDRISWPSSPDPAGRVYGADGQPLGPAFDLSPPEFGGAEAFPQAGALSDGGFVVAWFAEVWSQVSAPLGVFARRFDAAGQPVGAEFSVATGAGNIGQQPAVTGLTGGGFVVTWSASTPSGSIEARVYDATGVAVGGEITVEAPGIGAAKPVVTALPDGGFAIAWKFYSPAEIHLQRFEADGTPRGDTVTANVAVPGFSNNPEPASIIATDDGELIVVWQMGHSATPTLSDIYAQRYQIDNRATEQVSLPIANAITVGDDGLGTNVVTVILSVDFGLLTVATGGSGVAASGNGTAAVALTGTVNQINALLTGGAGSPVSYLANSDTPPAGATLTVEVRDVENLVASSSVPIAIASIEDQAVAQPDVATTTEAASASGNLFADNGSSADHDPDGPALTVAAVNGNAAAVGTTITLASGALLTVQANGNYHYDPNGRYNALPAAGSGASNLTAQDSFSYTLANGGTATVTLTITGLDSDDTLLGTAGNDTLIGGSGDDIYFVNASGDIVQENGGGGNDAVYASASYGIAASAEIETLAATSPSATTAINLTGNSGINSITGNAGANILNGGGGADTLNGLGGDDQFYVDNVGDVIVEAVGGGTDRVFASVSYALGAAAEVETLSTTDNAGTGAINLTGNGFANTIAGNAGANVLDGGAGNDTLNGLGGIDALVGGMGNDQFYVDNIGDVVVEAFGGGTDRVFASVDYALGAAAEVEILSTTNNAGTGAISLIGNGFANSIVGNAGVNVLNGGGGADTLNGLGGDDQLYVDNAGDIIVEAVGGGTDRVFASVSYALGAAAEVEVLSTTNDAGTGAISLTGNGFANSIAGNAGANVLNGGGGADTLNGLGGDDQLYVDNAGDVVIEAVGGGSDRVFASVSYALGAAAEVEVLSTTDNAGTGAINLTGNGFANSLAGNAGANVLNGGGGADTLNGLGGNDMLYVDNIGDVVIEAIGGGSDRVFASVDYALGAAAEVEILSTTNNAGTGAISLIGNGFANSIAGNAGVNVLNGGGGADTLNGLGGDDQLYVDNAGDVVVEAIGGGTDRVFATVSYALAAAAEVEVLSTTNDAGTGAIDLTGNGFANAIAGNDGANVLNGGGGSDTLYGLGGTDTFRFTAPLGAGNVDTIVGYSVADDGIQVDDAVFTGLAAGALATGAFNTGAAATEADDRIIYNPATGALLFDADGSGAGAAVQFATLSPGLAMAASEFFVI